MQAIKAIVARRYGRPSNWGRCFSLERAAGRFAVGDTVRVVLADDFGIEWRGLALCFGVTQRPGGRAVYDFEKLGR